MSKRLLVQELLEKLTFNDETVEIEAKRGVDTGTSALETVSALSNEPALGGGYIIFGVEEHGQSLFGRSYAVSGVPDTAKMQEDFASQCATAFNIAVRPEISIERDPQTKKKVVVAYIPEADAAAKPIYLVSRGLPSGAFRRIASTDQKCTEDDLLLFFHQRGTRAYDESIVSGATFEDLDPKAFEVYRRVRQRVHPAAPEINYDDRELAHSVFAVDRDRDGELRPTVAGIVCFGSPAALRRHAPRWRVDFLRVEGTDWIKDPEKRFDTIEIREPLVTAIPRALQLLLEDVPRAFVLPGAAASREDRPLLPPLALREAIVNAVMHRNYRTKQPVQIIRYSNRVEIKNPGASLVPDERLGDPGSVTRNEKIAAILQDMGFAEEKGSGVRAMRNSVAAAGLIPPLLESDRARDEFTALFTFHHFLSKDDVQWLERFGHLNLTEDDQRALIYVREVGAINNAAYRSFSDADRLTASSHLRTLRDKELLLQRGKGTGTYYIAGPRFNLSAPVPPERRRSSPPPHATAAREEPLTRARVFERMPAEAAQRLGNLGRYVRADALRTAILELLSYSDLSIREVADTLGKSQQLMHKVMRSMSDLHLIELVGGPPGRRRLYRPTKQAKASRPRNGLQEEVKK